MSTITRNEHAGAMFSVEGRFFNVVTADNGRILNQTFKATRQYKEGKHDYRITVEVRFDDNCNNGHESFAITADIRERSGEYWREYSGGCCHDEIARRFPELAHLIKWHLTSTDEPMHYVANAVYHADEHGPVYAWVYYTGESDPLQIGKTGERLVGYIKANEARKCEGTQGYRVQWDEKTSKTRNLDHARSCAVWPEATDAELCAPDLADKLRARLPALVAAFEADMRAAGFVWPVHTVALEAA